MESGTRSVVLVKNIRSRESRLKSLISGGFFIFPGALEVDLKCNMLFFCNVIIALLDNTGIVVVEYKYDA